MGIAILDVYFDDEMMDSLYVDKSEAKRIAESIEKYGFSNYNEDVKRDWFNLCNGRDNPKVSVKIIEE